MEAAALAPRRLIASAIDIVVFIERTPVGRAITEIVEVNGVVGENYEVRALEGEV